MPLSTLSSVLLVVGVLVVAVFTVTFKLVLREVRDESGRELPQARLHRERCRPRRGLRRAVVARAHYLQAAVVAFSITAILLMCLSMAAAVGAMLLCTL